MKTFIKDLVKEVIKGVVLTCVFVFILLVVYHLFIALGKTHENALNAIIAYAAITTTALIDSIADKKKD